LPKDWAITEVLVVGWRIGLTICVAVAVASIVVVTVEVRFEEHENVAIMLELLN
jgi:putative exporter of polyketide antibiotics